MMLGSACAVAIVAMSPPTSASPTPTVAERPECPHTWPRRISLKIEALANGSAVVGEEIDGPTFPSRNIPEFNDCQRIILPVNAVTDSTSYGGAPARYGPMMALFASDRLAELDSVHGGTTSTMVFPAVQIFNYAQAFTYHPLAITPLYNCLYLWGRPGSRRARMVPFGRDPNCPSLPATALATRGAPLEVIEARQGVFTSANDYPVAARWEWDRSSNTQYISFRCGNHWCSVGRPRQGSIAEFRAEPTYLRVPTSGSPLSEDRVRAIPGWYDSQRLAMKTGAGLVPSGVVGWVFPAPDLKLHAWAAYRDTFITVGHVALSADSANAPGVSYYKRKFNYELVRPESPLGAMTELALCLGTTTSCSVPNGAQNQLTAACGATEQDPAFLAGPAPGGGPVQQSSIIPPLDPKARWIMRVRAPSGERQYRCVTRRIDAHAGTITVPATMRWRWLLEDETTWDFCSMGCCEMSAK